jgi:hypothetical protein
VNLGRPYALEKPTNRREVYENSSAAETGGILKPFPKIFTSNAQSEVRA